MKVLMTGGGSAGHITPILSVATELKKQLPQVHIRYVGQRGDSLGALTDTADSGIDSSTVIFAGKWRRYHGIGFWAHATDWRTILKNARDMVFFGIGFVQSLWLLVRWRPQVVFVKGGFVGLPVGLAAALLRIPIVTHDSDALPGLTNRVLARFARKQCVGLPIQYYRQYAPQKLVHTGVPISDRYHPLSTEAVQALKQKLQLPADSQVLSIFGGSLGAIRINEAVVQVVPTLLEKLPKLHVLHITGNQQATEIASIYGELDAKLAERVWSWPFVTNLHEITGVSDIVIARSGATSIAELGEQKKAVIVVPNPYLTGGHQTYNARLLEENNAALVVSEKRLHEASYSLFDTIFELFRDEERRRVIGDNLHALSKPDAAAKIAAILVEVIS